jgi:hypothetical protein
VFASTVAFTQKKTCDLKLRVFSYDEMSLPKNRLVNVSIKVKGEGIDQKFDVSSSLEYGLGTLREGKYRIDLEKPGYQNRMKQVELDCDLVDNENGVWVHVYMWRDRKSPATESDLVADDDRGPTSGTSREATDTLKGGGVSRRVNIQVVIDEDGNVISASRIDGDRKLADRATIMARRAKFSPTLIKGVPTRITGSLTYNFMQ